MVAIKIKAVNGSITAKQSINRNKRLTNIFNNEKICTESGLISFS